MQQLEFNGELVDATFDVQLESGDTQPLASCRILQEERSRQGERLYDYSHECLREVPFPAEEAITKLPGQSSFAAQMLLLQMESSNTPLEALSTYSCEELTDLMPWMNENPYSFQKSLNAMCPESLGEEDETTQHHVDVPMDEPPVLAAPPFGGLDGGQSLLDLVNAGGSDSDEEHVIEEKDSERVSFDQPFPVLTERWQTHPTSRQVLGGYSSQILRESRQEASQRMCQGRAPPSPGRSLEQFSFGHCATSEARRRVPSPVSLAKPSQCAPPSLKHDGVYDARTKPPPSVLPPSIRHPPMKPAAIRYSLIKRDSQPIRNFRRKGLRHNKGLRQSTLTFVPLRR